MDHDFIANDFVAHYKRSWEDLLVFDSIDIDIDVFDRWVSVLWY